jgi:adenylate cyclase
MRAYFFTELRYIFRSYWRKWGSPFIEVSIGAAIAFGSVFLGGTRDWQQLDHWVLKHFFQLRGPMPAPEGVVIVAIDDESYKDLDASTNFPLPRKYIAEALEAIEAASPKAIILDSKIPSQPNMEPEADDRIEAALRAGPTSIWTGEMPGEKSELNFEKNLSPTVLGSAERFRKAAKMELPMTIAGNGEMLLYVSYGTDPNATLYERAPIAKALVELAHLNIEKPGPFDLINFYGPKGTIHRIALHSLIRPENDAVNEQLRDKIVLMGYQSIAYGRGAMNKDEFTVPVSSFPMYGVEIHANIIGNLIDRSWLKQPPRITERKLLLLLTLLIACAGMSLSAMKGISTVTVLTVVVVMIDYYAFSVRKLWIAGIGSFLVASAVTIIAIAIYRIWGTERFRKYINKMLGFEPQKK